ncbi:MAG TPA: hypothetical protein EYP25_01975 [Anaerolineae bacterium]|nr:V-type ATPase subunit [Caldilineae bacterium]HID33338.1 hypothetical protein [Anaerolineae bacterium]HIQ11762.1 hypothetical protein [Caldilineales bacterium]
MPTAIDLGYDYINARLRVMRSRLLTRGDLGRLLSSPNIPALVGALVQTPYREALKRAMVTHSGVLAVHRALQLNQNATLQRIASFCSGETARIFQLLMATHIRHNVITLLRGANARIPATELLPLLVIVPPFTEGVLNELAHKTTVRGLVQLLDQWRLPTPDLARALTDALRQSTDLIFLERRFNRAWAEAAWAAADSIRGDEGDLLRLNLRRDLDLRNLLLALDFHSIALEEPPDYLPGGLLIPDLLEAFRAAADPAEMSQVLAREPAAAFWLPALTKWDKLNPANLQLAWETELICWRQRLFYITDPLGPGILIAYLSAKAAELRNLRLITEAVAEHLSREDAEANFIFCTTG